MEPFFRPATDADAELLLQMMREYYAYDGHVFEERHARIALLAFLREPSYGRAWLICENSTPVGYILLTFGYSLEYLGRDAFIDEFFLLPPYRGRGWGRAALNFVEDAARAAGVRAIHLEIFRANNTAKEVYLRSGYVDHARHLMSKWIERGFFKPGSE